MSERRRILSEKAFSTPSTVNIYHTPKNTENKSSSQDTVTEFTNPEAQINSYSKSNDMDVLENDDTENKKHTNDQKQNSKITSFIKQRRIKNNSESSYDYALATENQEEKSANAQRYLFFRVEKLMRYLHELNNDEIERKMYFDFDIPQILPVQVRKGNLNCILFKQCLDKIMPDIECMNCARFRRVILEEVLIGNPQVFRRLKSGTRNAWKLRKNYGIFLKTENLDEIENLDRVDVDENDDDSSQDTCSSVDSYFEASKLHREFDQIELNDSGENTGEISSEDENDTEIEIKNKSPTNGIKNSESTEPESHSCPKITRKTPKSNHPVFDHKNRDFEKEYKHYEAQIQTRLDKYCVYENKLKEKQVKQIQHRLETERIMKKNEPESEIITKPVKSGFYNADGYYEETNEKDDNHELAYNEKYETVINGNNTYGGNTFIDNTNNNLSHFDMMQMSVQQDYLENQETILKEKGYLNKWLADSNFEEQTEVTPLSVISLKNEQEQELDCNKCWKKDEGDCFIQIVEEDLVI